MLLAMSAFVDAIRDALRRAIAERDLTETDVAVGTGVSLSSINAFLGRKRGMQLENVGLLFDWLRAQGSDLDLPSLPAGMQADGSPASRADVAAMIAEALRPFSKANRPKARKPLHRKSRPA